MKAPRPQRKRQRLGNSESGTQRLRAERVNHVVSYDMSSIKTEDGRRLKWLPICDEFSWELVALEVERRMESKDVIRNLGGRARTRERAGVHPAATTAPKSSRWPCRTGSRDAV